LSIETNVLFIYPCFFAGSFWNYTNTCELVGAEYPAPPLGLITVAAMLPSHWDCQLIDKNTTDLVGSEINAAIAAADLVMIGGMLPQQMDMLSVISQCRQLGTPVVVGGPDATSSPHIYAEANFRVLGEVEVIIQDFIAAWEAGAREGEFVAEKFTVDVSKTPLPRFDLLDFSKYLMVNVQFSRGCPFLCEFCDIIELYGRKPRSKGFDQILGELQRLYDLGYRGHVDFVDDNLIGNKKLVKQFLPVLIEWQKQRRYPFVFSTEASLNLSDDHVFLNAMREANFFAIFIGIESPDPDVLVATQKKQNTKRDIAECIKKINLAGIFVLGGFIVGFDEEKSNVSNTMIDLIEEANIPVCMVGLLFALPNTQLTRRLASEGRLHDGHDVVTGGTSADQCTAGLNFETLRPRSEILDDYRSVVEHIYAPENYFTRITDMCSQLDMSGANGALHAPQLKHDSTFLFRFLWNVTWKYPDMRKSVWKLLFNCLRRNPRAIKAAMYNAALYAHLGQFSQIVTTEISRQITDSRKSELIEPPAMHAAETTA
jgi:radical SAM superfamily enzyme YgiQ (UPF0313 family)